MSEHYQDRPQTEGLVEQSSHPIFPEEDRTPRAEKPQIVATQPTPISAEDGREEDFFAFDPSEAQYSTAAPDIRGSPTPSVISHASSSRLRDAVLDVTRRLSTQFDLGSNTRPSVQRDLSHASATSIESTDSAATVMPSSPRQVRQTSTLNPAFYPNQAFAALHHQQYPPLHVPPHPNLRPGLLPSVPAAAPIPGSVRLAGIRTHENSPVVTPGLFSLSPKRSTSGTQAADSGYSTPYLHHLHTQVPKETHVADIDVDPISGNKMINDYEIVDELGRGTHGKVKLGRSVITGTYVAIKIVERFPKKRRLGRLGNTDDKVKREVAILKKARHPHVVALLEVIDDPARRKVYIVLERVELGEIPWRTAGTREVSIVEYRRYERESRGDFHDTRAELEDQAIIDLGRIRRVKALRTAQRERRRQDHDGAWSLEFAGDIDEDSEFDSASRMSSSVGDISSPELEHILSRSAENLGQLHSTDVLATVIPARTSSHDFQSQLPQQDRELAESLSGTMYGPFDEPPSSSDPRPSSPKNDHVPRDPVITEDDVNADIQDLTRNLSQGDLAARAADILDCDLHPDLMYVPCMTLQAARESFRDTVLGLQYLHFQGIIHRDIKPPNLLQTRDYRTKISDFGVSYLGRPRNDADSDDLSDTEPDFDEAKELAKNVGTAAFYAPELCFNETGSDHPPIGKAIDIWALGVTLFCMIFARVPFVDTEYVVMRRIAEEEVYIPAKRLRPVPKEMGKENASLYNRHISRHGQYRSPNTVEYEELDDTLLDLLKRLLIKDVKKRATLDEVRHHPWVLEDLQDKIGWLDMSAPANTAEGKKIEISREDVEFSVVPINLLDKIKSGLKKAAGSVGLGRSSSTRKRNPSQEGSGASASSSSSAINAEGRRRSLRGDEQLLHALKASRDLEHPLAQSVTASPLNSPQQFPEFPHAITTSLGTPRASATSHSLATAHQPRREDEQLDKSVSTLSTAGSSRTVRATSKHAQESYFDPALSTSPTSPATVDSAGSAHLTGLLNGATRLLKTVRDRSATGRSSTPSSHSSEAGDAHGDPSIAISTASAEGQLNAPDILKGPTPISSRAASRAGSPTPLQRNPITTPDVNSRQGAFDDFDRLKHSPTSSSVVRNPVLFSDHKPPTPQTRPVSRLLNESAESDFDRAEDELLRRHIAEGLQRQSGGPATLVLQNQPDCALSPDEDSGIEGAFRAVARSVDGSIPPSTAPSFGTGPASTSSSVMPLITPVSSEDRFRAEPMSDTSHGSISSNHGHDQHEDLRHAHSETIADADTVGDLPQGAIGVPSKTSHHAPLDDDDGYHPDAALDSDDDFDDSSDDDGGLQMMRRRPDPRASARSASASNTQLARYRSRRDTGDSRISKKSRRDSSKSTKQSAVGRAGSEPDDSRGRKQSMSLT